MDWSDIALHGLGAIAIVGFAGLWKPYFALGFNTTFWPVREVLQHNGVPNSLQSNLEWIVPVALGWFVFAWIMNYEANEEINKW